MKNMNLNLEVVSALLDKRSLVLFIVTIIAFLLGLLSTYLLGESSLIVFPKGTSLVVLTLIIFITSFLFFGYLSPMIMFLTGSYAGYLYSSIGVPLTEPILLSLAALITSYSAIRLGDSLLKDMVGRSNFLTVLKVSLALLVTGIALSLVGDLLVRPEIFAF